MAFEKIIVAGSRTVTDIKAVDTAIGLVSAQGTFAKEIISGTASGVDRLGEKYAENHDIPVKRFPADWDKFGRSAGYHRNVEMANYGTCLIAVWDGKSRGTKHMINIAMEKKLRCYFFIVNMKKRTIKQVSYQQLKEKYHVTG